MAIVKLPYKLALVAALVVLSIPCVYSDSKLNKSELDSANWLTYGNGYANRRSSQLRQINRHNVQKLVPAWIVQTGVLGTFPTNPLVVDGVMFFSTPFNHVIAVDAVTGKEKWRYQHSMESDKLCCGSHNRGLAWGYGKLYMISADGRFIALEAKSGQVHFDIPVVDPMTGKEEDLEGIREFNTQTSKAFGKMTRFAGNMAPVVFDKKVFVGVSGTGYSAILDDAETSGISELGKPGVRRGLRAFITAYDAFDGKLIWRWYSTASGNWEGSFSATTEFGEDLNRDIEQEKSDAAKYKDAWKTGGGSIYSSPTIDPESKLIFFGTGNPSPTYDDKVRPGDNLYTSSVVALKTDSGDLAWYKQIIPHDIWGYDVAAPPVLITMQGDSGENIEVVAAASKTGRLFFLGKEDGRTLGRSEMFVPKNSNMFRQPTTEGIEVAPGAAGGANWPPLAYDNMLNLLFVPASHRPTRYRSVRQEDGSFINQLSLKTNLEWGTFSAISPENGTIEWQIKTDLAIVSGALVTDGGLVFYGESDGRFVARDSRNGKLLWAFETGAGVNAPPITYELNGKQYVAVASGGHSLFGYKKGNAVISFALP